MITVYTGGAENPVATQFIRLHATSVTTWHGRLKKLGSDDGEGKPGWL